MQSLKNRVQPDAIYDRNWSVTTILNGKEVWPANERILIKKGQTSVTLQNQPGGKGTSWQAMVGVFAPAIVSAAEVGNFVDLIELSFANNHHRDVLTQSSKWRKFYHVDSRSLTYKERDGTPKAMAPLDTVPCFDCGLVLPLRNVDIDHQRPQAGNELEAVCKVFRAMGLTVDGPAGVKGQAWMAKWTGKVNGLGGAGIGTRDAKYTLNNIGEIYYSLVCTCGELQTLKTACMNHIVNLRPLCGACNKPNRNVQYY